VAEAQDLAVQAESAELAEAEAEAEAEVAVLVQGFVASHLLVQFADFEVHVRVVCCSGNGGSLLKREATWGKIEFVDATKCQISDQLRIVSA
jgi:hypothetical protein